MNSRRRAGSCSVKIASKISGGKFFLTSHHLVPLQRVQRLTAPKTSGK